ncbi:hypothetical protein [Anaerococcus cruorum]|uniref:DUF106 domain-containing protein n=1 Tax=Anaerococcus cruorum TaxID=3115617 RepID=A0ABW9MV78_9FIRM
MRSILKFLGLTIITILIPALFMGLATILGFKDIGVLIAQMLVILVFVFIFTNLLKYQRKYEVETEKLLANINDVEKLRTLRENRRTYKSKAAITSKILRKNYSDDEARTLLKYATTNEDMDHYYAAIIDQADKNDREILRKKRDDFEKRYGKKQLIFPDFNENLKTALKWMAFFFISAFLYNFLPPRLIKNDATMAAFLLLGMLFLAVVMVNTILWIVRTLKSYWAKDYL